MARGAAILFAFKLHCCLYFGTFSARRSDRELFPDIGVLQPTAPQLLPADDALIVHDVHRIKQTLAA
jgi:hypothetical protein